jgi:hypothetical protein
MVIHGTSHKPNMRQKQGIGSKEWWRLYENNPPKIARAEEELAKIKHLHKPKSWYMEYLRKELYKKTT